MKAIKKICVVFLIVILLGSLAGAAIVTFFQDDIKDYAVAELSKQLKTEIKVKEVDLTLWRQFPLASLRFSNVLIPETFEENDTLIYADEVFLNFKLSDFISGKYEVKEISIENSAIHLKKKANGEDNYHFWKEVEGESEEFSINLNSIILKNSLVTLEDKHTKVNLNIFATQSEITGLIGSNTLSLEGELDTYVKRLDVDNKSYLSNKTLSGTAKLNIQLDTDLYTLENCHLSVNELPLIIDGTIDLNEKDTHLNLVATTQKADLSSVVKNLPSFIQTKLDVFNSTGEFQSTIAVTGNVSSKRGPSIEASFKLDGAEIRNLGSGVELSNIYTNGTYILSPGKEDLLSFNQLNCQLGQGNFKASGKISRLSNPFINASVSGEIQLDEFAQFFNLTEIDYMNGSANLAVDYKGNFGKAWNPNAKNINNATVSGNCSVTNGELKLVRNPHVISEITGSLSLSGGNGTVEQLKAKVDDSDFLFSGTFDNVLAYLLIPDEKLKINSDLECENLDFNTLFSNSSTSSDSYKFKLPDHIDFELNTSIENMEFREFSASEVSSLMKLKNRQLKISPLKMKTSEGEFNSSITITQVSEDKLNIVSDGRIINMNISDLFESFENFGQKFITNNHLEGTITSDFSFRASMNNELELEPKSIDAVADLVVTDGELIGQNSLMEVGDYLVEKKLVNAMTNVNSISKKLEHVKFSKLSNTIIIKNETVQIPKMNVLSDALNIKAEGSHNFDNQISYSIGFDLADLTKREGLADDEKGMSKYVFISMNGSTSDPEFGYDKLAVKNQRKENRKEEKQKIKSLVKNEFSAKTSSAVIDKPKEQQDKKPRVTIEWNDSTDKKKSSTPDKEKKAKEIINNSPSEEDDDDDF